MNLTESTDDQYHSHADGTTHSHQQAAPYWVRFYDLIVRFVSLGRVEKMHRATLDLAQVRPGQSVLDMGCGTGSLALIAARIVGPQGQVVGLDVEPAMLAQAQQKAARSGSTVTFAQASIDDIPYPDNSFDVVISTAVIHHLTAAQVDKGLVELYRVLKPGGRLLIVDLDPSRRSLISRLPGHRHLAPQDHVQTELPGKLQAAAFHNITTGKHPFKQMSYAQGEKA